jgi:hypothetical protein
MKLVIEITMDNAAFDANAHGEAARILRQLVKDMTKDGSFTHLLKDVNGNRVGTAYLTTDALAALS